jgi:hypothetical protein
MVIRRFAEIADMPTLTYFRQKRMDGAIRSGIDIDTETVWQRFESTARSESDDSYDPALLWFIDVEFDGEGLPIQANEAKQWLLENTSEIQLWLTAQREAIRAGFDAAQAPLIFASPQFAPGVRALLRISSVRRVGVREVMEAVEEIAGTWPARIEELSQPSLV